MLGYLTLRERIHVRKKEKKREKKGKRRVWTKKNVLSG